MADDGGVWVKVFPDGDGGAPGAAVIGMNSVGVDSNPDGKPGGASDLGDGSYTYTDAGKTYRVLAFTTPTTSASIRLTDEARARITDEDLLMAVAAMQLPDDFTGDPVTLFDRKYSKQLRDALEVTPAVDPGLTLDVETAGFADVLVVGGGGSGGCNDSGTVHYCSGGGAGGFFAETVYLTSGTCAITVGAGGAGAGTFSANNSGNASSIADVAVIPGGSHGYSQGGAYSINGGMGASTGGTRASQAPATISIPGLGNDGGVTSNPTGGAGSGGGGAGASGNANSGTTGGAGGAGTASDITGSSLTFAGGGGGSGSTGGAGGAGGGGAGGSGSSASGTSGTANTGGGGGGTANRTSGNGGSGIVIVRVEI